MDFKQAISVAEKSARELIPKAKKNYARRRNSIW